MTRNTEELVRRLAEHLEPVRPLPPPWVRAGVWLALAAPYVALVVLVVSPRGDLPSKMVDVRFVIEQVAALATGVAAALAAFATVVPAHDRTLVVAPLLPLALWLGSLGHGCIQDWTQFGPGGLSWRSDWYCLPAIVVVGAVPAFVMAIMLHRGTPLTPRITTALGGLAAAALGNFGLRLFHPQDASVMILVWQFGTVVILSALAGCTGRYLLSWPAMATDGRQPAVIH